LLNQLKFLMRISPFYPDHAPAVIGSLCVAIAICLTGCASKNPLMEEPAAAGASSNAAAAVASAPATAAPATVASGVQTSKKRRFLGILSPYRVDIQQGNFVSREMVAQLKEGMTPDQVRFVMGTPLLTDIFHQDRWDYPFRLEKRDGEIISSRVTVFFKDNRVVRLDGGNSLPTEADYLALLAGKAAPVVTVIPGTAPAAAPANK
jgi:outer membrane protein assembly factor BamE